MSLLPSEKIKRKILILKKEESNPEWGCQPEKRDMTNWLEYGFVNVDKPSGPHSHKISELVKKIVGAWKAGHSGTLDPKVTGALPVALNNATRALSYLLKAGKEYVCLMKIHEQFPEQKIRKAMKSFVGKIIQKPPVRSAVKRVERERTIHYIQILEIKGQEVLFLVGCEAGTYIRKLCDDIGKKMGVRAHMLELRRTKVGVIHEDSCVSLQELSDAVALGDEKLLKKCVQPIERALLFTPKIWVSDFTVNSLCNGSRLWTSGASKMDKGLKKDDKVMLLTLKNELIGFGTLLVDGEELLEARKKPVLKVNTVIMKKCPYPKRVKRHV